MYASLHSFSVLISFWLFTFTFGDNFTKENYQGELSEGIFCEVDFQQGKGFSKDFLSEEKIFHRKVVFRGRGNFLEGISQSISKSVGYRLCVDDEMSGIEFSLLEYTLQKKREKRNKNITLQVYVKMHNQSG